MLNGPRETCYSHQTRTLNRCVSYYFIFLFLRLKKRACIPVLPLLTFESVVSSTMSAVLYISER